jgi:hypothetical protein
MKIDFDFVDVKIGKDYLDFTWACEFGFGHLITDWDFNILDNECMDDDFCNQVIEEGRKNMLNYFGGDLPLDI